MDLVSLIMDHEEGNLSMRGELELFSHLVKTGQAWTLQGHYGRVANALIEQGYLYEDGELSSFAEDAIADAEAEDPTDWDARNDDAMLGL